MKRNPIKTFRNRCDKLYQQVGTAKIQHCESCGRKVEGLCCHHFCPKSLSNALRYDLANCIVLCRGCHLKHHNGDPQIYENFMERKSAEWFEHIKSRRNELVIPTLSWYKENYERLKQIKNNF